MNSNLSQLIANRQFAKRHDARRELFAKVQQAADTEQIAWEEALRKIVLTPENAELLKLAQEPRRQRRARQRLSDAELERRMRQLESAVNNPYVDDTDTSLQQLSGSNNDILKTRFSIEQR